MKLYKHINAINLAMWCVSEGSKYLLRLSQVGGLRIAMVAFFTTSHHFEYVSRLFVSKLRKLSSSRPDLPSPIA